MTVRKSISFTDQHDAWIKAQVESGDYSSESEVIRTLIRDSLAREAMPADAWLRGEIQKGLDSGVSARSPEEVRKAAKDRLTRDERR